MEKMNLLWDITISMDADDMVHPSKMMQNIVWQRFAESFFTDETLAFLPQIDKLHKMLEQQRDRKSVV